ncbi:hypothetical protein WN943_001485 [Citrus x changshan-huyou]
MRSQEIEALQKSALVKNLVRKCNTMAVKAVICPRCGYMNGTVVRKAVALLGIIHDRSNVTETLEESAPVISHMKESKAAADVATYILNPAKVFHLFKMMTNETNCPMVLRLSG